MKNLLLLTLLGTVLAGCAPAPGMQSPLQPATSSNNDQAASGAATPFPASGAPASGARPVVITVRPPLLPIAPVKGSPLPNSGPAKGWQTFHSTLFGVAIDYPTDWLAGERAGVDLFASQAGLTIQLQSAAAAGAQPAGSASCNALTNRYGQTAELCFQSPNRYSAVFMKPGTATPWLVLSTVSDGQPEIYLQMFDTLRPET